MAVDSVGNLYIADSRNERIRALTPSTGRTRLDFAHFASGAGITSDLVLVNVAAHLIRPAIYFYDQGGNLIAAELVVDVTGDLLSGSVKVTSDRPIGGVLRFDLPDIGVAGVGASQPVRDAIFPARRQAGGISTAAAIHNLGEEVMVVSCRLMKTGIVLEEEEIHLSANGQEALYIEQMFASTDTSDFVGSVRCMAPSEGEGTFTGVAVELDASNQIFTTLPMVPVQR